MPVSPVTIIDFNLLSYCAAEAFLRSRFRDDLALYLFWVEVDPTLEAGYIAFHLAHCYEQLGDRSSAMYWARRAVSENPSVGEYKKLVDRLGEDDILPIIDAYKHSYPDKFGLSKKLRERARKERRPIWPPVSEERK